MIEAKDERVHRRKKDHGGLGSLPLRSPDPEASSERAEKSSIQSNRRTQRSAVLASIIIFVCGCGWHLLLNTDRADRAPGAPAARLQDEHANAKLERDITALQNEVMNQSIEIKALKSESAAQLDEHAKADSAAVSFPDPERLCSQNQFVESLSLPLKEYRRLGKEWIDRKVEIEKNLTGIGHEHLHDRFGAFQKMGSCNTSCIGGPCRTDTSKIACGVDRDTMEAPCIVYSVGGNNQWQFELDVLAKSPCDVHTFDCTGDEKRFNVPTEYGDRLKFHYVCLGTKNKDATGTTGKFWTLTRMQKTLGHDQIDLLKLDIEGYEFPLFDSWPILTDVRSPAVVLPMQILVEVHYQTQMTELSQFVNRDWKFSTDMINLQSKFLQMGYAVIERDDNSECPHCTELTLVRVQCPPTPRLVGHSLPETVISNEEEKVSVGSVGSLIDSELIPENSVVDVNIGTNWDPIVAKPGTHRILVDPLFYVCDSNAKITEEVTAFCFAVSNFTGFTTFYEYNSAGVSSSLSKVSAGTSHEKFSVLAKRTVLVLEAMVFFSSIHSRNTTINRLKLDMQGHELTTLRNIRDLLDDDYFILHMKAECFCPRNDNNKQIYEIDNSCFAISSLLQESGYETSGGCRGNGEWSDVTAHKRHPVLTFCLNMIGTGNTPPASSMR